MELTNTLRAAAAGSLLALALAAAPAFAEDNPVGATAACGHGDADSASHSPETLARAQLTPPTIDIAGTGAMAATTDRPGPSS